MRFSAAVLTTLLLVVVAGCATCPCKGKEVGALASGGKTGYSIVVPKDASATVRYAAEELQSHLKQMTGADFPIRTDAEPAVEREIVLGNNARLKQLHVNIDFSRLGMEGYVIRTHNDRLIIAGGEPRGTLYAVYGLLEDHFGCRWFTPTVSRIPRSDVLPLPQIDETKVPVLEYREPFTIDCFDGTWCARNRVNSSSGRLEARHGGKVRFGAGMFVHTFDRLVPPEEYFDTHPEYFSEINGKRVKDRTQLCCTNEEVVQICIDAVKKAIQDDPEAFVYSVSQNDWANNCECMKCQELAKAEGSQMAPVLQLVNRVAEAIEKDYPDKAIETLAYQWTRKPPKSMRPRPNVIIRLCSIECCFMHPLAVCDSKANREFVKDAEGWAKVANRLWVWDYITSFHEFMTPFPNLRVLNDNIQFFIKNNVRGIFEQDNYISLNGEMSPLGGYMVAKFLWNPDYCEDKAMMEFLNGVYGEKSAKYIRRYVDLLHDRVEKENIHANIWIGPDNSKFLDTEILAKADKLWDKAERAAAHDPAQLERVQTLRLSEDFAWIELHRHCVYDFDQKMNVARVNPELRARVKKFIDNAKRANVTRMAEAQITLDDYAKGFEEILNKPIEKLMPVEPVDAGTTQPGLKATWFEGEWERIPDMAALKAAGEFTSSIISIKQIPREENFAARFEGYFVAPETGLYCFQLKSNDGSRMKIANTVIDNDGLHDTDSKSKVVALKKGCHPLEVLYFQSGGNRELSVMVKGPENKNRPVPGAMLVH